MNLFFSKIFVTYIPMFLILNYYCHKDYCRPSTELYVTRHWLWMLLVRVPMDCNTNCTDTINSDIFLTEGLVIKTNSFMKTRANALSQQTLIIISWTMRHIEETFRNSCYIPLLNRNLLYLYYFDCEPFKKCIEQCTVINHFKA